MQSLQGTAASGIWPWGGNVPIQDWATPLPFPSMPIASTELARQQWSGFRTLRLFDPPYSHAPPMCPNICTFPNGVCDPRTLTCKCRKGWGGKVCNIRVIS